MSARQLPRPSTGRGARGAGIVFATLATAVLLLVATALSPSQPPPPAVAEYAPEAVKQLTQAPQDQTSQNGTAEGAGASSGGSDDKTPGTTTTTTSNGKFVDVKRVRHCVGNPPRQIEDPQSPPCVPYFDGDNGGATAPGVSATEIKISVPNQTGSDIKQLVKFFNNRFEFYGRQMVLDTNLSCFGTDPTDSVNKGNAAVKYKLFAVVGYCDGGGSEYHFFDTLARNHIVSVNNRVPTRTESDFARNHPYEWSFLPPYDKGMRHVGDLACALINQPARHAGPFLSTRTRKFGVIVNDFTDDTTPDHSALFARLAACGIDVSTTTEHVQFERSGLEGQQVSQETAQQAANAVLDLATKNVTTVIMAVHATTSQQIWAAAEGQGYQPEWELSTYQYNDEDFFVDNRASRDQLQHMFGVSVWNKFNRVEDEPWDWALEEQDPPHNYDTPPFSYFGARYDYYPLLVLAAGIQMAGPHLTPETFAAGLQRTTFPNPFTSLWPGKVTIQPGTHSYVEDAAVIWWSPSQNSDQYGTQGGFCYVENGKRRRIGGYGNEEQFLFNGNCQRY